MIQIVTLKSSPPETGFSSPGNSAYPVEPTGGGRSFQEYLERLDSTNRDRPNVESPKVNRAEGENTKRAKQGAEKTTPEDRGNFSQLDSSKDKRSSDQVEKEKSQRSGEMQKNGTEKSEKLEKDSRAAADTQGKTKSPGDSEKSLTLAPSAEVLAEELKSVKGDGTAKGGKDGKSDSLDKGKVRPSEGKAKGEASNEESLSIKETERGKEHSGKVKNDDKGAIEDVNKEQELETAELIDDAALSTALDGKVAQEASDATRELGTKNSEKMASRESELVSAQSEEKSDRRSGAELHLIDLRKKKVSSSSGEEKKGGKTEDKRTESFLDRIRGGHSARDKGNGAGDVSLTDQAGKGNSASMEQGDASRELRVIHIDAGAVKEGASSSDTGASMKDAAASLGKRFDQDVSGKVVKQASIILKDNNSGEIRLVLHPEKLGKVRIQLQLEDNRIAGRIFVDNASVRDLFESNVKNLAKAFAEEGFDQTKLDVFVGSRDSGKRKEGSSESSSRFDYDDSRIAVDRLETSVPLMNQYGSGDTIIDLVV